MPSTTSSPTILDADQAALAQVAQNMIAAWGDNDGAAFAKIFAEDGSLVLPGDVFLKSREEIRTFMTAAFASTYKGTRVTGTPLTVRALSSDVAVLITEGGVLMPGETEVSAAQAIRATWVLTKHEDGWLISAYHNSPVAV
jgi:uncharacterized protein (TIGR02246 family)